MSKNFGDYGKENLFLTGRNRLKEGQPSLSSLSCSGHQVEMIGLCDMVCYLARFNDNDTH